MTSTGERTNRARQNVILPVLATVAAIVIAGASMLSRVSYGDEKVQPEVTKWEYHLTGAVHKEGGFGFIDWDRTRQRISELGDDGWELVASNLGVPGDALIFKRPKR